ncbi:MAG TPA: cyanophycin synthetase, partial [Clostridia bacterium]|nr:cyanophycin synthetase [Clostridia bacterium]
TVIDDAYNSNPAGARAALAVLKEFTGRRILVTPGMVELGPEEDAFNRAFGKDMVGAVDQAVLIGHRHTEPIAEGLKEAGFDMNCVHRVSSLEESKATLATLLAAGDTVLFENDLPDNYQE